VFSKIIVKIKHFGKIFRRKLMLSFKILIKIRIFLMTGQNTEYATAAIIYQYNFKILWDISIPQGVTIVEKADVTSHQQSQFRTMNRRSDCRTGTAVDAARTTIAENLSVFRCFKRSEEHTSELQSRENLVCRLLL